MPRIGAILQGTGSLVRVFAPNATSLRVCGDWNGWNEATAVDLATADGGFWEGTRRGPRGRRPLRAARRPGHRRA